MQKKQLPRREGESRVRITKALMLMKLTAFLLLCTSLQVSAKVFSQEAKVTMKLKQASIETFFKTIERKTSYRFVYSNDVVPQRMTVSIDVRETPVSEVLSHVLDKTGLDFKLIENEVIVIANQKDIAFFARITGRVTDINGDPLEGVSVVVRGTSGGTVTDSRGYYVINAPSNGSLVFSYVGYETMEIPINGRTTVDIVLKGARQLQEVTVVSTGYQTISRERATGSYDVVGPEILSKRPVSNLSTALQGLVAGMQGSENTDGSVSYLIRGTSSMYAEKRPLVVVDGFPVADIDFSTINPNDVESVSVLKDAAAASIWGARSANGVIVITTKAGSIRKNQRLKIEGNAFVRISSMIDLDHNLTQANSADHIFYEKYAWDNNLLFSPYSGSLSQIGSSLTLAQEYIYKQKNGLISEAEMNRGLDSLSKISNRGQLEKYLLRNAVLNQYNVTLTGSTDKSRTYASLMYEKNRDGYVKNSYNRFNLNFNNQYDLARFLTFNFGTVIQYRNSETSGATLSEIQGISPYETLLDPDGSYSVNLKYNREQLATLPLELFPYSDWSYNLLREVRGRKITSEDLNARIQTGLTFKIMKGLTLDSRFQYERRKIENERYYSEETFEVRNTVNNMAKYNQNTGRVDTTYIPKGGILKNDNSTTEGYVFRNQLNFDRSFGKDHSVTAILGTEISQSTVSGRTNPWAYGYYPDRLISSVPQFGYGSSVDQLRNFLGNVTTISGSNTTLTWRRDKFVSFYGNAAYTYKGKYTFSASARSDASNYITDDPKLRWGPMWSIGGMWNINREDFMQDFDFVDRLNLRATYGKNGNAETSTSTKTLVTLGSTLSATTGTITASISDYGNPQLRWEKTTTTNIGLDFVLFRSKLRGKFDYYNRLGSDITGLVALPAAAGTTSQRFNNAKILNRGFEIELGTDLNITDRIRYSPTITYAFNKNRIQELYYPNLYAYALIGGTFVEGRPVGALYSYTYLGMEDGTPYVEGLDKGKQTFNDVALHNRALGLPFLNYEGSTVAPHTFGMMHMVDIHNFYVTALFVGKFGGVYRNPVFNYAATVGGSKTFINKFISEVVAGNPDLPGFSKANNTQTYLWDRYAPNLNTLVESSSYLECKEISVGYNLPKRIVGKAGMNAAKVYVQARNLGLVWAKNKANYHPEWLPGTNRPVETYMIGATVHF